MKQLAELIETHFLIFAFALSGLALWRPGLFTGLAPMIPQLLGLVMFGMGLTLRPGDFRRIWQQPNLVVLGVGLQFLIMPLLAWSLASLFQLPAAEFVGLVMVGACPGGTASNVITYLARANVALSVVLTLTTTLLSPLMTQLLIFVFAGTETTLSVPSLMHSVTAVILLPVLLGVLFRQVFQARFQAPFQIFPALSILAISLIIATVIAQNQAQIFAFPFLIGVAVILHNGLGLLFGYAGAKVFQMTEVDCRTIAIEVGMQNSGLGVTLASQFVGSLAALPGALFSLWHNVSGIALAKYWATHPGQAQP